MITLVGVGHVFDIAAQVKHVIKVRNPGAVCIELDQQRYDALREPQKGGDVPLPYKLLAFMQKRLAHQFGGEAGHEMLAAADAGKEINASVLLIDAEASNLFNRLWLEMSFREKVLLMVSSVSGLFMSKKRIDSEMETFQENEAIYMEQMGTQFPTMKRVLIDERNEVMAGRIAVAEQQYHSVVAIIGDGHIDGICKILNRPDIDVMRLKELLTIDINESIGKLDTTEAHFQFTTSQ